MKRFKLLAASALFALSMTGCGGGGGSSVSTDGSSVPATETVINGIASKGPINGTAKVYALDGNGNRGSLLKSTPITNGSYSANIGKYSGAILVEVTGSYTDEATGEPRTITADAPMRAALGNAAEYGTIAITPLTELAVRKAGVLTPAAIEAGNKLVSDIFRFDIIETLPVAPTATAVGTANQEQTDYTIALAAVSQLCETKAQDLTTTLESLAGSITATGMSSQKVSDFQGAVSDFLNNGNNDTGVSDPSGTGLPAINGSIGNIATFTLTIQQGPFAADAIKGLQFEVVIPDGLTLRTNTTGATIPGIVRASDAVAGAVLGPVATFSAGSNVLTFALASTSGIGAGELATIGCDLLPGWSTPSATAFSVRNLRAVDGNLADIGGVSVTVSRKL